MWEAAARFAPDLVLADHRGNAVTGRELEALPGWRALTAAAVVEPWNPDLPCSGAAAAAFLRSVADALELLRAKG
ncbi:hypothetical protein [Streptomyces sp. NBC_01615]|uniref:hypothetical protein n=1 Tax=Streptomyces sp. NBC_01615 TaxID=2975898 RepID=UPI00386E44E1